MTTVALIYNIKKHETHSNTARQLKNRVTTRSVSAKTRIKTKKAQIDSTPHDAFLEWDDPETVMAVKDVLSEHYKVMLLEADDHLWSKLQRHKKNINVAFNMAEKLSGSWREAAVPLMLEELGIPYTGSNPETLMLCLNKERTKQILAYHKIKFPSFKVFKDVPELDEKDIAPLGFPLIVKPLWEGSSKGIKNSSLVVGVKHCQNEIARIIQMYKEPVLIEEFIPGREFTIGVLGNGDDVMVLPIVELNFAELPKGSAPIYSYEAKWIWDVPEKPLNIFTCPAQISTGVEKYIKDIAVNAYNALGCHDWCRIDVRLDKTDKPYILELNPIPGILPDPKQNSCLPKAARAMGWDYSQLINRVLAITCKRYGIKHEQQYSYSI